MAFCDVCLTIKQFTIQLLNNQSKEEIKASCNLMIIISIIGIAADDGHNGSGSCSGIDHFIRLLFSSILIKLLFCVDYSINTQNYTTSSFNFAAPRVLQHLFQLYFDFIFVSFHFF